MTHSSEGKRRLTIKVKHVLLSPEKDIFVCGDVLLD